MTWVMYGIIICRIFTEGRKCRRVEHDIKIDSDRYRFITDFQMVTCEPIDTDAM